MKKAKITVLPEMNYAGKEAMNAICTNITFSGRNLKKILVTSCASGEGKSTMCDRICLTMGEQGCRCALVDADMRKSSMIKRFGLTFADEGAPITGLTHYLAGLCDLNAICYQTDLPNLCVVPAGRETSNPIALIKTREFKALLDNLSQSFDYVIVDTPPVGVVIDSAEIGRYCDGTVFVVEYAKRHRKELQNAVDQMRQSGCPILGCVIDKIPLNTLRTKKYYGYGDYHYKT